MEKIIAVLLAVIISLFVGLLTFAKGASIIILCTAVAALWIKPLWNWLMPVVFGLPEITYTQAWGLLILSSGLLARSNPAPPANKKEA
jgi:hypothetical protein